jgi:hypothetical protein
MALAESPAVEDEIVLGHLRQCEIKCATSSWRQNNVIECPSRDNRLDCSAAARAE